MSSGDKTTIFLSVLQTHKGIIYKIANAYCSDEDNRKDLVQEITIQLWKSFDKYNESFKYSTWVYRIALNTAISFYRKENRRKQISASLSNNIIEVTDEPAKPPDAALQLLNNFIAALREMDKALMLLYLEEKSYKEIAEITGISQTNVATKISRIKLLLKQKFTNINL